LQRNGFLLFPAQHFLIGEGEAPSVIRLSLGGVDGVGVLERALRATAGVLQSQASGVRSIV